MMEIFQEEEDRIKAEREAIFGAINHYVSSDSEEENYDCSDTELVAEIEAEMANQGQGQGQDQEQGQEQEQGQDQE